MNFSTSHKCECEKDWTGENCDVFDPCSSVPCQDKGICIADQKNGYVCSCFTGYSGKK